MASAAACLTEAWRSLVLRSKFLYKNLLFSKRNAAKAQRIPGILLVSATNYYIMIIVIIPFKDGPRGWRHSERRKVNLMTARIRNKEGHMPLVLVELC